MNKINSEEEKVVVPRIQFLFIEKKIKAKGYYCTLIHLYWQATTDTTVPDFHQSFIIFPVILQLLPSFLTWPNKILKKNTYCISKLIKPGVEKEALCTWDIFALIKDRGAHEVKSSLVITSKHSSNKKKKSVFYCIS